MEDYWSYPGPSLMRSLKESLDAHDAGTFARLAQKIGRALLSESYRHDPSAWDPLQESQARSGHALPPDADGSGLQKPCFDVLIVTPNDPENWDETRRQLQRLRRREDPFTYHVVMVGSFEDAAIATALNESIQAVVIYDGFAFSSRHDAPLLRDHLTRYADFDGESLAAEGRGLGTKLAALIKNFRPELDIYLITDRSVEALAASDEAAAIRRIFFDVEEALEIHLSIMDGVNDRYRTPYFSNLLNYSPEARSGPSTPSQSPAASRSSTRIGSATWASSTAPTSSWPNPQPRPAGSTACSSRRATSRRRRSSPPGPSARIAVYLATNGTSTSNKIVVQALCAPGDIIIVDRNCHKSHHYGFVLSGAQPLLRRGVPAHRILDVRGGAAAHHQEGASRPQGGGQARPRQARRPDELHVRRPHVQHAARDGGVPGDQAGPDLPLGRGVVRLCAVLASAPPPLGDGRRQGAQRRSIAATRLPQGVRGARAAIEGMEPNDPKLLDMRLLPDPDKVRIRAYQTNSTHKSMSAFRQGSMIAIWDEDFAKVEGTFQEAFLTHTSTSPNLQLIASLDVARRQMELEGYELTMRDDRPRDRAAQPHQHASADLEVLPGRDAPRR